MQELGGEGPYNLFRDLPAAGFDWQEGESDKVSEGAGGVRDFALKAGG